MVTKLQQHAVRIVNQPLGQHTIAQLLDCAIVKTTCHNLVMNGPDPRTTTSLVELPTTTTPPENQELATTEMIMTSTTTPASTAPPVEDGKPQRTIQSVLRGITRPEPHPTRPEPQRTSLFIPGQTPVIRRQKRDVVSPTQDPIPDWKDMRYPERLDRLSEIAAATTTKNLLWYAARKPRPRKTIARMLNTFNRMELVRPMSTWMQIIQDCKPPMVAAECHSLRQAIFHHLSVDYPSDSLLRELQTIGRTIVGGLLAIFSPDTELPKELQTKYL